MLVFWIIVFVSTLVCIAGKPKSDVVDDVLDVIRRKTTEEPWEYETSQTYQTPPVFVTTPRLETPPRIKTPTAPPRFKKPPGVDILPRFKKPPGFYMPPRFKRPPGFDIPPRFKRPPGIDIPPRFGAPFSPYPFPPYFPQVGSRNNFNIEQDIQRSMQNMFNRIQSALFGVTLNGNNYRGDNFVKPQEHHQGGTTGDETGLFNRRAHYANGDESKVKHAKHGHKKHHKFLIDPRKDLDEEDE